MLIAKVYITLKKGILDPQGKAVKGSFALIRVRRSKRGAGWEIYRINF